MRDARSARPQAHARIRNNPTPLIPRTMPIPTNSSAFSIKSFPAIGAPGTKNARLTKNPAIPIRKMTNAARTTSTPNIVIPSGRGKIGPPHGKEEQDGNASGAERRAQITPTGLCHSSTAHSSPRRHRLAAIKRFAFRQRGMAWPWGQSVKLATVLATQMAREFKLPDIGEGVHEGEVVKWFVKEGDAVKENDPVVEVMTDKVTVQIPSPVTGKILQLRAKEGEVVKVGSTLVVFGEAGEAVPASAPAAAPTVSTMPAAPSRMAAPPPPPSVPGEVLAAPAVRRLARELNVDLAAVRGSGPQGRIT